MCRSDTACTGFKRLDDDALFSDLCVGEVRATTNGQNQVGYGAQMIWCWCKS